MRAAFYRATRPGLQGIYSRLARLVDRGPYAHCELLFSDGLSASASYIDGGVRFKAIDYSQHPEHWDFMDLPDDLEDYARDWFKRNMGAPYDLMGNVRFVLPFLPDSQRGWFCSEALGAALGWKEPWRFGPNGAAAMVRTMYPQPIPPTGGGAHALHEDSNDRRRPAEVRLTQETIDYMTELVQQAVRQAVSEVNRGEQRIPNIETPK